MSVKTGNVETKYSWFNHTKKEAKSDNPYSWHSEVMTILEMREIERGIENIRLIKDAALAKPGLLERIGIGLGVALVKKGTNLHSQRISPCQAYQITSCKIAS